MSYRQFTIPIQQKLVEIGEEEILTCEGCPHLSRNPTSCCLFNVELFSHDAEEKMPEPCDECYEITVYAETVMEAMGIESEQLPDRSG